MKSIQFKSILILCLLNIGLFAQEKKTDILTKLDKRDSIGALSTGKVLDKNVVTREFHNALFKNIYPDKNNHNEEDAFKAELKRLHAFDDKKIDTIIYIQVDAFGQNVYDTNARGSKMEHFLSHSLHTNTKIHAIKNRFMLFEIGEYFSPYKAIENARLIRNSGIFHDVKFSARKSEKDPNNIDLLVYIQDVFPYGFNFSFGSFRNFSVGIENRNIGGTTHRLAINTVYNANDTHQTTGFSARYTIPNIIKKQYFDAYSQLSYYSMDKGYEMGISRTFSRPEFKYAGGNIIAYRDQGKKAITDTTLFSKGFFNDLWASYAIPFKTKNTTLNAIIVGAKYSHKNFISRPYVSSSENSNYWNTNFLLFSAGYSRMKFIQDRLLNGFGRTEDVPVGISVNGLYGLDFTEYGLRKYYGGQVVAQYYSKDGYYINFGAKSGFYHHDTKSEGVFDFNLQNSTPAYKIGNFRFKNYLNFRTTFGINQDPIKYITLNEYNGVRGLDNGSQTGRSRFSASYQTNLFLPFSFIGFRFNLFGLVEIAKIQKDFSDFFGTPFYTGITGGISIKNENLVFDAIQLQYSLYPSTSGLQKGFSISSLIPFKYQSLDISKPMEVVYE